MRLLILLALSAVHCNGVVNPSWKPRTGRQQQCVCVPFYQCGSDGKITTGGEGQIDVRVKPDQSEGSECKELDEVCCIPPGDEPPAYVDNIYQNPRPGSSTEEPYRHPDGQGQVYPSRPYKGPQVSPVTHEPEQGQPNAHYPFVETGEDHTPQTRLCGLRRSLDYGDNPFKKSGHPGQIIEVVAVVRVNVTISETKEPSFPEPTSYGEFPWMVGLFSNDPYDQRLICGGSLISQDTVLTGAHCVWNLTKYDVSIKAGKWNLDSDREHFPVQTRNIKRIFVHENFNKDSLHFNVAVLKLSEPFELSEVVDTVCLSSDPFSHSYNPRRCIATGWGKKQFERQSNFQKVLRKVHVPLVDREPCQAALRAERLGKYFRLHDSFICAGGIPEQDTCYGDGGGPLFCQMEQNSQQYTQVGITSWGLGCGNPIPAVYASVEYLYPWIQDHLDP